MQKLWILKWKSLNQKEIWMFVIYLNKKIKY